VEEQAGRDQWFDNLRNVARPHDSINIRSKVRSPASGGHNEEGLLGLAFHPGFKDNRQVFLHYSAHRPVRNVLARFVMDRKRQLIEPASEQVLLEVTQRWGNHNGGMIEFGPDGYLYLALGDGGAANDPLGSGQDKSTLLGAILRIDVDHRDPPKAYAVPNDNPFVGDRGARPEIWAYGLRNVWRFSFDRQTGDLWAGDVGQNQWEEIDLIQRGGNYGWNYREGKHDFRPPSDGLPHNLIEPIVDHARHEAKSITGGYVYRGTRIPELVGAYVYGDYVTGLIWALRYDGRNVDGPVVLGRVPEIASFGEDRDGEIYIVSLRGRIFKLMPKSN
ncbi:MAG: PQQ-dependent sugar dehydrogenase, partial [Phycisphaeraceae bacterium]